ncbi:hypothetical protein DL96DRAFT_1556981 [Flagelloscypha sp. PMI_526]|nr:hypothetical protein DL96DRAFT_1556981 [Flagelloscypha sp. PMI_526]
MQIYLQRVDVDQSIDNVVKHVANNGSTGTPSLSCSHEHFTQAYLDRQHIISSTSYGQQTCSESTKTPTLSNAQAALQHLTVLQSHEISAHSNDSTPQGQINAQHTEPAVREEIKNEHSSRPVLGQSCTRVEGKLGRMIFYLTATASEDWGLMMEVCEQASLSESHAKEAVHALRQEFKYGGGAGGQLTAARLFALFLRNSSPYVVTQLALPKFLDTIKDIFISSRTSQAVRERLVTIIGAAAYASTRERKDGFRGLWQKLRPAMMPKEGMPFAEIDPLLLPPAESYV